MIAAAEKIALEAVILEVVNSRAWPRGSLTSLSTEAIEQWITANRINPDRMLVNLIHGVSEIFGRLTDSECAPFPSERDDLVADLRSRLEAIAAELAGDT